MAKSNKLFDTQFRGYKKQQVSDYVEKIKNQYQEALDKKNKECENLIKEKDALAWKHSQLQASYIELQDEKNKIADVLINAENTAKEIVMQAKADAVKEKENLDNQVDEKRMLIVDLNKSIRDMKLDISKLAEGIEERFTDIVGQISQRVEEEKNYIYASVDELNRKLSDEVEEIEEELVEEEI